MGGGEQGPWSRVCVLWGWGEHQASREGCRGMRGSAQLQLRPQPAHAPDGNAGEGKHVEHEEDGAEEMHLPREGGRRAAACGERC